MRNKKIFSFLVCILFIFAIMSVNVFADSKENPEMIDNKIISTNYHIELDGYFDKAFHFIYFKNPVNDICSLMMSVIRFNDADISINDHFIV